MTKNTIAAMTSAAVAMAPAVPTMTSSAVIMIMNGPIIPHVAGQYLNFIKNN